MWIFSLNSSVGFCERLNRFARKMVRLFPDWCSDGFFLNSFEALYQTCLNERRMTCPARLLCGLSHMFRRSMNTWTKWDWVWNSHYSFITRKKIQTIDGLSPTHQFQFEIICSFYPLPAIPFTTEFGFWLIFSDTIINNLRMKKYIYMRTTMKKMFSTHFNLKSFKYYASNVECSISLHRVCEKSLRLCGLACVSKCVSACVCVCSCVQMFSEWRGFFSRILPCKYYVWIGFVRRHTLQEQTRER